MGLYASEVMVGLMRFAPVIELIPKAAIGSGSSATSHWVYKAPQLLPGII